MPDRRFSCARTSPACPGAVTDAPFAPRPAWSAACGHLLAVELDLAGDAHRLVVFPALARLCAHRGCPRPGSHGDVTLRPVTAGLHAAISRIRSGLVAVRIDQFSDRELGVPGRRYLVPISVLLALHAFFLDGHARSVRDCRIGADISMDGAIRLWPARPPDAQIQSRHAFVRARHARPDSCLA